MIVVTGATGALNGTTVERLLDRVPPQRVGVSVRDVEKARHLGDRGVRVRRGAYDDPGCLAGVVRGRRRGAARVRQRPARRRGRPAPHGGREGGRGGRHAHPLHQPPGRRPRQPVPPAGVHAATEAILAASGVAWTSLRNGFYAHSLDWLLGPWQQTGVIAAPADGPVTLTARNAVTLDDIAEIVSELTGRDVERVVVDDEDWVADQVAHGAPEFVARLLLTTFRAAREGRFAGVDPLLVQLLGREPRTVAELLADRVAA